MNGANEIIQIRVGQFEVGIVGLKVAVEKAVEAALSSEEEVAQYMLEQLKSRNYIPARAESEYAKAFLKEYKKHLGQAVEPEKPQGLEVKVLGPGCPNCDKLEQMLYQVMETENIIGRVEHVRDPKEIASYGLVGVPALVINGEVKSVGRLPRASQVKQWLWEAKER